MTIVNWNCGHLDASASPARDLHALDEGVSVLVRRRATRQDFHPLPSDVQGGEAAVFQTQFHHRRISRYGPRLSWLSQLSKGEASL